MQERREEKSVRVRSLLTGGLIVVLVVVWLLWWQWDRVRDGLCALAAGESASETALDTAAAGGDVSTAREAARAAAARSWEEWLGEPPVWPDDLADPRDCAEVEEELERVCSRLDAGEVLSSSGLADGSCGLLMAAAEELSRRPPDLSSELSSYESMLGNVHHLFRVLGGRRVDLLRRLGAEEQEHVEPVAMALYRWMASREGCAPAGRTAIRLQPLYDYSGFVFNTMGGQAYLRRRPPVVEGLAAFYALLVLDRALEQDHNPWGLDPRPEIRRTRELLSEQSLVFSERYVALLDEMEQRWKRKSPRP